MDESTRRLVRERAGHCCEYCGLPQQYSPLARLQIEHIIPKKHGGRDHPENLALACIECNLHKGSNLTGIDPDSGQIAELFTPRTEVWAEHFRRRGLNIIGLTPTGRATVRVLDMNSRERMQVRLVAGTGHAGT